MTRTLDRWQIVLLAAGLAALALDPAPARARTLASDDGGSARVSMDHHLTVRRGPPPLRQAEIARAKSPASRAPTRAERSAAERGAGAPGRPASSGR